MQLVMWKYYRYKKLSSLNFINLVEYAEYSQAACLEREKMEKGEREKEINRKKKKNAGRGQLRCKEILVRKREPSACPWKYGKWHKQCWSRQVLAQHVLGNADGMTASHFAAPMPSCSTSLPCSHLRGSRTTSPRGKANGNALGPGAHLLSIRKWYTPLKSPCCSLILPVPMTPFSPSIAHPQEL